MCTAPIKLINNSKNFDPFRDHLYHVVPCGRCLECKSSRREDWFVRCFFQWQQHVDSTYFYTLTYNDENLPYYNGYKCFDKRGTQLFIKRLRKLLLPYEIKLKYIITCEFGELYKRPHLHALFFLSHALSPILFKKLVNDAWKQGFCVPGDNYGLVNSATGIKYVTKYITKDDSFVELYERKFCRMLLFKWYRLYFRSVSDPVRPPRGRVCFDTYNLQSLQVPVAETLYNNFYQSAYRDYQQKMPFHIQSVNLGLSALDHIHSDHQDKLFLPGIGSRNIPRYIRRKLWFDRCPNMLDGGLTSFCLNAAGRDHELITFEAKYQLQLTKNYANISALMEYGEAHIKCILRQAAKSVDFADIDMVLLYDSCKSFFDNHTRRELLALYMSTYRNRCCPYDLDESWSPSYFIDKRRKFYIRNLYDMSIANFGYLKEYWFVSCNKIPSPVVEDIPITYMPFSDITLGNFLESRLWNNHVLFTDCEFFATLLDSVELYRRDLECNDRKRKDVSVRRLRQRYRKIK